MLLLLFLKDEEREEIFTLLVYFRNTLDKGTRKRLITIGLSLPLGYINITTNSICPG